MGKANVASRITIGFNVCWELARVTAHHSIHVPMGQRSPLLLHGLEAKEGNASPGPQLEPYLDLTQNYSAF